MLQDIRKSTRGTTAKIVVGLIVISFSIFGLESILVGGSGGSIAEVNGEKVLPDEVLQEINVLKRRLIAAMGDQLDPTMLDDDLLSARALESVIAKKLQLQAAADFDLTVSDRQIGTLVSSMEQFQINGEFSPEMYRSLLSGAGFTPASFKQGLAQDLLLSQLSSGLAGSDFSTAAELKLNAEYAAESRDIRFFTIPADKFSSADSIPDEDVEQYYQDNQSRFQTEETVDLDYIELTLESFRKPVAEAIVLEQYELEKENYQYKTESRVSHILFEQDGDESDEAFQLRIQAIQEQLTSGVEFAELARTSSDDVGSATYGGDLGFTQGETFPEEIESAIARLDVGAISEPVQSDAGIHLLKLEEQRDGQMPSLEELRAELEDRVQTLEARRELSLVVEKLKDIAFNAEDLSEPAAELELEVKQVASISRKTEEGLLSYSSLLTAAFSDAVLLEGHNSDVIELPGDTYVALSVRKHSLPELKPLESVESQIVSSISQSVAGRAMVAAADAALAALNGGSSIESFANDNKYEWQVELAAYRASSVVPRTILQRAFELPTPGPGESVFEYVMSPEGDVQVLELARVTPGALTALAPAQRTELREQVKSEFARMGNTEFQRGVRNRAEISVL
ncbi:MAG: peptidyl-prolyl cis-trans isomerase D [Halioglobus sp.]|jgi:peptidyl-prolyl cis-trans isomerase D